MSMSTFYEDGYQDGIAGKPKNPPVAFFDGRGRLVTIYVTEYLLGYSFGISDAAAKG